MSTPIQLQAVGIIEARRARAEDDYWGDEQASITLEEHIPPDALAGITDFSHVEILYVFH